MQKLLTISLTMALCGTFAAAQQMGCLATNSSVIGSYTFIATEMPFSGVAVTPPGTTTNSQIFSNTPIGQLVANINGGGAFSTGGVLYFDGAGHILVASATAPLAPSTQVGTYTVNSDCTINVAITDVFNTATSGPGVTTPTFATINLIGLVLSGGSELDLSVAQTPTSSNGNMPIVAGEFASRLFIQAIRSFPYGCSAASLTGSYGLVGTGFALLNSTTTGTTTTGGTTQPVTVLASITFDGAGNITTVPVTSPSPLASFQFTGTYTVNLNCSGTITLSAPKPTTTTTTTTTATPLITANFVLIPPVAFVTTGTATLTGSADRPSLLFTAASATQTISGFGRAQ